MEFVKKKCLTNQRLAVTFMPRGVLPQRDERELLPILNININIQDIMSAATKVAAEIPWHAAFPAPRGVAPSISREELLQWIRGGKQAGKDFVLVDLRRADYEVETIDKFR
jgi:hypothetical protein